MQLELPDTALFDPIRLGSAIAALIVAGTIGHLIGAGVARLLNRVDRAPRYARLSRRLVRWFGITIGIVIALHILGLTGVASSLLATGGVVAIILGFAFRDIGENLLAGIFLAFGRSFGVGDLIESGGLRGIVQAIELRDTHIRTADGRDIFIPSAAIYRNPLINFTRDGLRRGSFTIGVDYGDDPEEALALLERTVTGVDGVLDDPPAEGEISQFEGAWMTLELHFWINSYSGLFVAEVRTRAMIAARRALLEAGFTLSSNTTTSLQMAPLEVRMQREARDEKTGG